ncbi:SHOCT domain-containing protein [Lentisalinibacter sediminis]|uniref:SHOCT domain-containing protein n=1 Tax=Lentisalinibacter sediminis TaxID=2992237 RepID=UPI00386D37DC
MRILVIGIATLAAGCATLTEDAMTPVALSFSDGSEGICELQNKRGIWSADLPGTVSIRKSDDVLKYDCETENGRSVTGGIPSRMGGKIVASAVFIDFGITDAITDKHREYPANFVIPVKREESAAEGVSGTTAESAAGVTNGQTDRYQQLETLNDLRERGIITDEEFEAEKKKVLESE